MNKYTAITPHVFVCNDCGSYADTPSQVIHEPDCTLGSDRFREALKDANRLVIRETKATEDAPSD